MKLLYIGKKQGKPTHGWEQINLRNQKVVEKLFDKVDYLPLDSDSFCSNLFFGITDAFLNKVSKQLLNKYDYVFVSHSLCGRVCKYIKKQFPHVKIITFFHNIEIQYASEYYKVSGVKALPFLIRVKIFEKQAVKYSDVHITLNDRDAALLKEIYGVSSQACLPTSLEDNFIFKEHVDSPIDYLFVGAGFYANIDGVQWFIDNVLPNVEGQLYIIGKGMSEDKFNNLSNRIHVFGYVEDLTEYYNRAIFVISPIFHGGGMKTKTAEALMYGKHIIGTTEAFEGYVMDKNFMFLCNTSQEFVDVINNYRLKIVSYSDNARKHFLKYHSYESSISQLRDVIKSLNNDTEERHKQEIP